MASADHERAWILAAYLLAYTAGILTGFLIGAW